jgi:hypothetical protein
MLPPGEYTLMGDRFYGTSALVKLCQNLGWSYRIRMKGNLLFSQGERSTSLKEAYDRGERALENATFHKTDVTTHVGILHEPGHPEPWYG